MTPSVGEPGYLPYCGNCPTMMRMVRKENCFKCVACGMETRRVNGEDMFDRTAPIPECKHERVNHRGRCFECGEYQHIV